MPQLDKVTFLSQFFWLCFFYIGFYFLILKFFLPKMGLLLKLRLNKLQGSQDNVNNLIQENKKIHNYYDSLFNKNLIMCKNTFSGKLRLLETWLQGNYHYIEKKHYSNLTKTYINSVATTALSENLFKQQFHPEISQNMYVKLMLKTLKNSSKKFNNKKKK